MFENIKKFFKKSNKKETLNTNSKDTAKERLHLVLMQDRANVSADFLDLMRQEIIEVIKKYIDIDESAMDVRLTNQANEDGTQGAPALYANIPILNIKDETRSMKKEDDLVEKINILETEKDEKENKEQENTTNDKQKNENIELKDEKEDKIEEEKLLEEEQKIEEAKKIVEENIIEHEKDENNKETQQDIENNKKERKDE